MNPIFFNLESEFQSVFGLRRCRNECQDMYFYVFGPIVVGIGEVNTYGIFFVLFVLGRVGSSLFYSCFYCIKVSLESFQDFPFSLTNILHATGFAAYAVDEI